MSKEELRKKLIAERRSLSLSEMFEASKSISERFFSDVPLGGAGYLHTFIRIPKFNEIDTSMIYLRVWRDRPEIVTLAPRIDHSTGEIESVVFSSATTLVQDRWSIREPQEGEKVSADKMDIILVPMLGFDESGHRVGYGKGFYDRFLAKTRPDALRVGLCHRRPLETTIETHEGDVPLDICITPSETFRFSQDAFR